MLALETASRATYDKTVVRQLKQLLVVGAAVIGVCLMGLAAAPTASAASNPNRQVGVWRANYACRGLKPTHTWAVNYGYGSQGTYGYLRLYQKGRKICIVNLASARTMGKKMPRGITVFRGSGEDVIARSYADARHYVSVDKQLPKAHLNLTIEVFVAFSRTSSDAVASADVNIRI